MESTYEISSESQYFIVKELLIGALYIILGYVIFTYFFPEIILYGWIIMLAWYITVDLIPCFIIHLQYYKLNKRMKMSIDSDTRMFTITDRELTYSFSFSEIKSIKLKLCSVLYRGGRRGMSAWELYHYAVLEKEGNERFIITCLLVNDLRQLFNTHGLNIKKEKVFIPYVNAG